MSKKSKKKKVGSFIMDDKMKQQHSLNDCPPGEIPELKNYTHDPFNKHIDAPVQTTCGVPVSTSVNDNEMAPENVDDEFDIEHTDITEIVNTVIKAQVRTLEMCGSLSEAVNRLSEDILAIKELLLDFTKEGN